MTLIVVSIIMLLFAFAGIAIRILLKKDGEFAGTCSSNNPILRDEIGGCPVCGALPEEECQSPDLPAVKKQ